MMDLVSPYTLFFSIYFLILGSLATYIGTDVKTVITVFTTVGANIFEIIRILSVNNSIYMVYLRHDPFSIYQ